MSTLSPSPLLADADIPLSWRLKRFTVEEYHRMIDSGALTEDDHLELLDGLVVSKMPKNPAHDGTVDLLLYTLNRLLPKGWYLRIQNVLAAMDSETEPDLAVTRGKPGDFLHEHPRGDQIALIVEVADSSVNSDRDKRRIYARAGIPVYWIVNLQDRCLEVFSEPQGTGRAADYSVQHRLELTDEAELVIAGASCGRLPVSDIIKV